MAPKNTFDLTVQQVSNDKYLKLYKIQSNLVDYNQDNLETSLSFLMKVKKCFLD